MWPDKTYFFGAITIPNLEAIGVVGATITANLNWFIGTYEPEYLQLVLGKALADAFISGLNVPENEEVPEKWVNLKNKFVDETNKLSPIAGYVYYHFMRDRLTSSVSGGESQSKSENAERVTNSDKAVTAYNKAIVAGRVIRQWVEDNTDIYTEYVLDSYNELGESESESLNGHMNNFGL